jgi:6-phosphogluconolactonase
MRTVIRRLKPTTVVFLLAGILYCDAAAQNPDRTSPLPPEAGRLRIYIGTYTRGASQGVYLSQLDLATGALTPPKLAAEVQNPSFLAVHPTGNFLYTAGELADFGGQKAGAVSAFAVDLQSGELKLLNQQPSGGSGPCHLVVDTAGKNVLVANYSAGSVAVLPLQKDGLLREPSTVIQHRGSGPDPQRQKGPHAHSINLDADNRLAFAADLGLDRILIYRFDADQGKLVAHDPPFAAVAPGAGPRHFAFHPSGKYAYVINEMHSTVTAFGYDSQAGKLQTLQTLATLPADFQASNTTAEVQVHPSGKFLYGSNRGHDSIAVFAIDTATGKLTPIQHQSTQGKTPRNFGIDPTGKYLLAANMDSSTLVSLRIDSASGVLRPTGHAIDVPFPVCVKMLRMP